MSKLGQEELLECLETCYQTVRYQGNRILSYPRKYQEALQQLKEIVEDWFKYIHTVNFEKPYAVEPMTKILKEQQKPKVISEVQASRIFGSDYWGEFVDRLKEIGVEVEDD